MKEKLSSSQIQTLLETLKNRFLQHSYRHADCQWSSIEEKLLINPSKCRSILLMEQTGGEPDVIGYDADNNQYLICDCAPESPIARRSFCYDAEALASRKENKPLHNAVDSAAEMGITLLTESEYRTLQALEKVDTKTSSWLLTPPEVRALGGAIFGDCRYDRVFVYHNGAQSYYAGRGFRGMLRV